MSVTPHFRPSSRARKCLVDLITEVGFGTIRDLRIKNGLPVFSPAPKIVRNIKFGGKERHDARAQSPKFHKEQLAQLFEVIEEIGDGSIESLEIQTGLPFKLNVAYDYQF